MTQIFNNYSEHKVFDIIKANGFKKILIRMKAGLGDAMMFRAVCLPALKDAVEGLYSACADIIDVDVQVHNGQDVIFAKKDVYCGDLSYYEAVFELEFPDNCFKWEGADTLTKPETCLRDELGLPYMNAKEYYYGTGNYVNSSFVGIHLFSTCYAGLNCPEEFARNLWQQIADNGLIPLDTYIETPGGKNRYKAYDFETQNLKGVTPGIDKLSRVISSCAGFASVSSGNFFLALQYMPPQKILFLQTIFRPVKLTRLPVHVVDAKAPYNSATEKAVQDWIDDFKGEHY